MKYDFDKITDRSGTFAIKWDAAPGELPMWVADMDFETAPEVKAAVEERAAHGIYGYTDLPDEWRLAYVNWWKERHHLDINPKSLVFCSGVVPAISSMVRKLTTPAEKVLIQTPVYNVFYNCILNSGRQVLENPLKLVEGSDGAKYGNGSADNNALREDPGSGLYYEIDFEDLAARLADPQCSLMILCNPQNPSGRIWTREELAKIGELAKANGVTVISDEIHCDLTDPGYEYVPFASVSETCRQISVTCIAPTKTFNIAGLHSAAVFADDPQLRHRVWRGINTDDVGEPGAFAPIATIAAFTKGGPWLDELRGYLAENKKLFEDFLRTELPQIRLIEGHATYLCWLDCSKITQDDKALQVFLRKEARLFVAAGSAYGAAGKGFLRINIACPRSMAEEGFARLKKGIEAFRQLKSE